MSHSENQPTHFHLIIVGDEILSGKRQDKHMSRCIELLTERGLSLASAEYVGDSPDHIADALGRAFARPGITFSTGGIGATPDDHTRQCAARALGLPLALHPQAEALIRERMRDLAREQGKTYEPDHPDNVHRLNMGVFPQGATLIPNPYNKIPGFTCKGSQGLVHFVPGFPVMAWPMMAWALDHYHAHLFQKGSWQERSVVVFGAMEASLTPLMERCESVHPRVKVFSLPSVDHPVHGRHIELGVKGHPNDVDEAFQTLRHGLIEFGAELGPELVR